MLRSDETHFSLTNTFRIVLQITKQDTSGSLRIYHYRSLILLSIKVYSGDLCINASFETKVYLHMRSFNCT